MGKRFIIITISDQRISEADHGMEGNLTTDLTEFSYRRRAGLVPNLATHIILRGHVHAHSTYRVIKKTLDSTFEIYFWD